jgi:hypothetical protein
VCVHTRSKLYSSQTELPASICGVQVPGGQLRVGARVRQAAARRWQPPSSAGQGTPRKPRQAHLAAFQHTRTAQPTWPVASQPARRPTPRPVNPPTPSRLRLSPTPKCWRQARIRDAQRGAFRLAQCHGPRASLWSSGPVHASCIQCGQSRPTCRAFGGRPKGQETCAWRGCGTKESALLIGAVGQPRHGQRARNAARQAPRSLGCVPSVGGAAHSHCYVVRRWGCVGEPHRARDGRGRRRLPGAPPGDRGDLAPPALMWKI